MRDKGFVERLKEAKNNPANPDVASKIKDEEESRSKRREKDEDKYLDHLQASYARGWSPTRVKAVMEVVRSRMKGGRSKR